jgi:hypothetical protein
MDSLNVHTDGMDFSYTGNCGFSASYDYRSDPDTPPPSWFKRRKAST